jgi:hypothetical protein
MTAVKALFVDFCMCGLCPNLNTIDHILDAMITVFRLETIKHVGGLSDRQIQTYFELSPKMIDDVKTIRNCCLTGKVIYPKADQPYNDEGVPVYRSTDPDHKHMWYCGRYLGMDVMPGSDGHCGPHDGPACPACAYFSANAATGGPEKDRKVKTGTGAHQEIARLHAQEGGYNAREFGYIEKIANQDQEIYELQNRYDWLENSASERHRLLNAEITELKEKLKRKNIEHINEFLTDLCSGDLPGSLYDVQEASRQAKKLKQNLKAQVKTMTEREMAENKAPDYFVCPIGSELMTDPVMTSNGFTYEKSAIERWFEENNTDPKTNLVLEDKTLTPNVQLRQAIQAYVAAKRLPE